MSAHVISIHSFGINRSSFGAGHARPCENNNIKQILALRVSCGLARKTKGHQ